jgi:dihydrofolate reductase
VRWAPSLEAALAQLHAETVYIIGGGDVYAQALAAGVVDRVYLTRVHARPVCDTFLAPLGPHGLVRTYQSHVQTDPASGLPYTFEAHDRTPPHPQLPQGPALEALFFAQMMA